MDIFDSFVTWLKDLFKPLIELYNEDSTAFFVGAIILVLILLIIVIVLARRAEGDDKKPSKKIKYEDIDWSVPGEGNSGERASASERLTASERAPSGKVPDVYDAAVNKSFGVGDVDLDRNTFGHEGLPPEVTEALMKSIRTDKKDIAVPMWMTKQTLSIDDIELQDAQEWVEQQLREKEAQAHDRQVERATVERIAEILEKIDLCDKAKEDYKKRQAELEKSKPAEESEKIDLDEIAPLEPLSVPEKEQADEPGPAAVTDQTYDNEEYTEPVTGQEPDEEPLLETGTLAKILREAEEIKAEGYGGEAVMNGVDLDDEDEPQWGVAATLAKLEAMQSENDALLKELEEDASLPEDFGEKKNGPDLEVFEDKATEAVSVNAEQELSVSEPEVVGSIDDTDDGRLSAAEERRGLFSGKRFGRRYGANNRDTNRSGKKFTEEELMKQIRD